jgi:hypothetical protein
MPRLSIWSFILYNGGDWKANCTKYLHKAIGLSSISTTSEYDESAQETKHFLTELTADYLILEKLENIGITTLEQIKRAEMHVAEYSHYREIILNNIKPEFGVDAKFSDAVMGKITDSVITILQNAIRGLIPIKAEGGVFKATKIMEMYFIFEEGTESKLEHFRDRFNYSSIFIHFDTRKLFKRRDVLDKLREQMPLQQNIYAHQNSANLFLPIKKLVDIFNV